MKTIITIAVLSTTLAIWYLSAILRNYRIARKTGLPIYINITSPYNLGWIVLSNRVGLMAMGRILPRFLFERVRLTMPGWAFHCKYDIFEDLGPSFVSVSCGHLAVVTADPEMAYAILTKRKGFERPRLVSYMFGIFGPNVFTTNNEEWSRHRRIIAPALNERIMNEVWNESSKQAREMLESFMKTPTAGDSTETSSTIDGMKTIAINVIGSVVFDTKSSFSEPAGAEVSKGFETTFMQSTKTLVNNLIIAAIFSVKFLTLPFAPAIMRKLGVAKKEFPLHLEEKISQERLNPSTQSSLIAILGNMGDEKQSAMEHSSKTTTQLSNQEIIGNLFILTIAGFDTTANTLAYAILFLAANPEWQDWIIGGIDHVLEKDVKADYSTSFPLLTRCLALMFETMRLYSPAVNLGRVTTESIQINDVYYPAGLDVHVDITALHTSPHIWGADALTFRPSRWIEGGDPLCETLREPPRGTFIPWSIGPRYCPGVKMAQVEFVSVIREIFGAWRVEIVQKVGESLETARERLSMLAADSSPGVSLQVNKPRDAVLRWIKR